LGFVTMMIFGVAYHVIPRFTGHPLHSRRLAGMQWWLANIGLALFVAGLALLPATMYGSSARIVVAAGGLLSGARGVRVRLQHVAYDRRPVAPPHR
jgi:cbb3-type cytochrome oxidase subunit 1